MIERREVARYLLERGLIDAEAVLDGDLVVRDASSRNRNYSVQRTTGAGYFVKQASGGEMGVAHEARVYAQLQHGDASIGSYLPRCFGYDPARGVLVLELLEHTENMRSLHLRGGRFSAAPAALLGAALATLHSAPAPAGPIPAPAGAPWILSLHRPESHLFRDASAASLTLVRIVQETPGFGEALDGLREGWRAERIVHADLKWDNCLVGPDREGREQLRLIDWESAVVGDPAWDIGSALSHYLSFWLFSIPVTGATPAERFPELAGYPLDAMKPALGACWRAYAEGRGHTGAGAAEELTRALRLSGARLIQSAFEAAQMMQQLSSCLVLHLQLALNVLQRPAQAAGELLGLGADVAGG